MKLKPKLNKEAKERQILGGKMKVPLNSAEAIEVRDKLANLAQVGHDTINKVEFIEKKAPPELKKKLESGEKSMKILPIERGRPSKENTENFPEFKNKSKEGKKNDTCF